MQNDTLLEIANLKINFNLNNSVIHAVRDISFKLKKNEILGVVGESGSGKSVTCMSILKLLLEPPASIESGFIKYKHLFNYIYTHTHIHIYTYTYTYTYIITSIFF